MQLVLHSESASPHSWETPQESIQLYDLNISISHLLWFVIHEIKSIITVEAKYYYSTCQIVLVTHTSHPAPSNALHTSDLLLHFSGDMTKCHFSLRQIEDYRWKVSKVGCQFRVTLDNFKYWVAQLLQLWHDGIHSSESLVSPWHNSEISSLSCSDARDIIHVINNKRKDYFYLADKSRFFSFFFTIFN